MGGSVEEQKAFSWPRCSGAVGPQSWERAHRGQARFSVRLFSGGTQDAWGIYGFYLFRTETDKDI